MNLENFLQWQKWENRNILENIKYSGIYIIAISPRNLESEKFSWLSEIAYVGMTNSATGPKGRFKQFDNTIIGKTGHGGADKFRYNHQNYTTLIENLYVSVVPFKCDVKSNNPEDLEIMGKVAKFEYDCFAKYVELFCNLQEFNNKKISPKYSLTYGKNKISQ